MDSPFNHSSGDGSSFGSGLPVCAIHAGHVPLPRRSPILSHRKNSFASQPCTDQDPCFSNSPLLDTTEKGSSKARNPSCMVSDTVPARAVLTDCNGAS